MPRRIIIVGGVAAGATAAARARRLDEEADITIVEAGPYVSFANCGLPYHIGGAIPRRSKLILQTPEGFESRYRIRVLVRTKALEIDRAGKRLLIEGPETNPGGPNLGGQSSDLGDSKSEGQSWLEYDSLILAQGGNPVMPPIPGSGLPSVFKLWNIPDMDKIISYIKEKTPRTAAVIGGGFIGLEMAEALSLRGIAVSVIEKMPRLMSTMDSEFGALIAAKLASKGIQVICGKGLASVLPPGSTKSPSALQSGGGSTAEAGAADSEAEGAVQLDDGSVLPAGLVLMSVGVRPELGLARAAGLEIGPAGGLTVDSFLATSDPSIWAAGDMIETTNRISGKKQRVPLAGPANRQGRAAASNALGAAMRYPGAAGTSVFKLFDSTVAAAGLSEKAARDAGYNAGTAIIVKEQHVAYYPGAAEIFLKIIYDRANGRLLGAEAFGGEGVERRIDVLALAAEAGLSLDILAGADFAYAPPYGAPNDLVNVAAFVGQNDISGYSPLETAAELEGAIAGTELENAAAPFILDVRNRTEFEEGHIEGALNIPLDEIRDSLDQIPVDRPVHIYCRSGYRAHLALRILAGHGWKQLKNLTGGWLAWEAYKGLIQPTKE